MATVSPIFIYTIPRSGSSMVTSIFAAHGLHVGRIEETEPHGYKVFENLDIREAVDRISMPDQVTRMKFLVAPYGPDSLRNIFQRYMPRDKRWVYKSGITHYPLFKGLYSDMCHVIVLRNQKSVIESNLAKGHGQRDKTEKLIDYWSTFIEGLPDEYPVVMTDDVVRGDYSTLEAAFHYCGLELKEELADEVIDISKWRF